MKNIMRIGLDLAKSVFVLYGIDDRERCQLRKNLKRSAVLRFFAELPPCLVGMEAGSGAHYWARELRDLGHDARIIDPRLVAPYRSQGRTGKNDSNDAAARLQERPPARRLARSRAEAILVYLRTLLVHGARSKLMHVHRRTDAKSQWAHRLRQEKSWDKVSVALANKHARIAWAILRHEF